MARGTSEIAQAGEAAQSIVTSNALASFSANPGDSEHRVARKPDLSLGRQGRQCGADGSTRETIQTGPALHIKSPMLNAAAKKSTDTLTLLTLRHAAVDALFQRIENGTTEMAAPLPPVS